MNRHAIVALAFILLVPAPVVHAAWPSGGTRISPLPAVNLDHYGGVLGPDGAGGAFVLWSRAIFNPVDLYDQISVFGQRIDAAGDVAAGWPAGGVEISHENVFTGPIYHRRLVAFLPDGAGGYYLPFMTVGFLVESYRTLEILHLGPDASLQYLTDPPFGGWRAFEAAADADGASGMVVLIAQDIHVPPGVDPPPKHLYVQRLDANGDPLWPAGDAPGPTLIPAGQHDNNLGQLAVVSDGAGGLYAAWIDHRDATGGPGGTVDPDLYVQHVLANGTIDPSWPAGGAPVCTAAGAQRYPTLALAGPGSVFVGWRDSRDAQPRLYVSCLVAGGVLAPGSPADGRPIGDPDDEVTLVRMLPDGTGGALVLRTHRPFATFTGRAYCHRIRPDGLPQAGWPTSGVPLDADAGIPAASMSGDGAAGAYLIFMDTDGLRAQHLLADGTPAPGWNASGAPLAGSGHPGFDIATTGSAIALWTDSRHPEGTTVYAHRLGPDGPVAVTVSLVSAEVDAGVVTVRWMVAADAEVRWTVWRRTQDTDWTPIGSPSPDGAGRIECQDRAASTGTRCGYRLSYEAPEGTQVAGETWIDVPTPAFALEPPRSALVDGALSLEYSLPGAGEARFELIDVAGRRWFARDLGAPGAGRHTVSLREARALPAGLYFARLLHEGASRLQRVIVCR
jgi:hypothetical protein